MFLSHRDLQTEKITVHKLVFLLPLPHSLSAGCRLCCSLVNLISVKFEVTVLRYKQQNSFELRSKIREC